MREFSILDHTADVMIEGVGKSIEEAFESIALALINVMINHNNITAKSKIKDKIQVRTKNIEDVLIDFLNKLIFLKDVKKFVFSDIKVKISQDDEVFVVEFELFGDYYNSGNYDFEVDVKGASYSGLEIKELNGKYVCRCIVDV
jgi:SHS2 domain-containing protein